MQIFQALLSCMHTSPTLVKCRDGATCLEAIVSSLGIGGQAALGPRTTVFLSDVETDVWGPGTVANLSMHSARWLVTRGELGADEVTNGVLTHLPPEKVQFCTLPSRTDGLNCHVTVRLDHVDVFGGLG